MAHSGLGSKKCANPVRSPRRASASHSRTCKLRQEFYSDDALDYIVSHCGLQNLRKDVPGLASIPRVSSYTKAGFNVPMCPG